MAGKGDRNRSIGKAYSQSSYWVLKDREWCGCKHSKVEYELYNKNVTIQPFADVTSPTLCRECYKLLDTSKKVLYKQI